MPPVTCNPSFFESDGVRGPSKKNVKKSNVLLFVSTRPTDRRFFYDPLLYGSATNHDVLETSWSFSLEYMTCRNLCPSQDELKLCNEVLRKVPVVLRQPRHPRDARGSNHLVVVYLASRKTQKFSCSSIGCVELCFTRWFCFVRHW